ncbi:MAG: enoyl-CoA hydratase/isomerase family protein [Candidatus Bathyarchaeota archaeon]|nr:enoyl-CoA hydratase/isomerase family protein [Candidatus Bathyarchaeota archaeon]
MAYELLILDREEKVGRITLNRPQKRNALSADLRYEIDRAIRELEGDEGISVAVITGAGPAFCAGFDTTEFGITDPEFQKKAEESAARYHHHLQHFKKPIVAAVNGPALGGGLDMAVLCDVRIAAENAVFGHPEVKFGAPALYAPLAELIGGSLARDLCLTGRRIDAHEAHRIGLVSQVVPPDRLMEEAMNTARLIAEAPLGTLIAIKGMILGGYPWRFPEPGAAESSGLFEGSITPQT